jgi:diacylglycerol kinase
MRHNFWQSFQYAGRGLRAALASQRTMRVHVALAVFVAAAAAWLRLGAWETALLILCIAAVLAAELLNTALETVVDLLVGDNHHELAGRAKDLSAAAVLVAAAGTAVAGLLVLAPPIAETVGAGRVDAVTVGRAAILAALSGLAVLALMGVGVRGDSRRRGG